MKDDGVADAKISKGGDTQEGMELRRESEREKLAGRPRRRNEVHKDERE